MWAFFSRRLRMWVLLAIALPLTRTLVHRLALAAERRDPSTRTAKALHQADSTVTAVSRRAARKAERRKAERLPVTPDEAPAQRRDRLGAASATSAPTCTTSPPGP
jgi:hypothetical protein